MLFEKKPQEAGWTGPLVPVLQLRKTLGERESGEEEGI